ncbi:alanyl-tRNA editing protein [Bacillus sp. S3]|uniref:alanyl-tRNA editing protein n=1 Tax=Bacillus sp. S3 TaxID=486398 RepID=UPI001189E19A|nr:DHHA1 domain-containing protein [Bacillus sp. S3]QCJ43940.1 alanyl-tRNA editing protein [Bacillus sp. S3]
MNNKLYYQDAYIHTFTARILKQEKDEAGNWYVILDQTAYYPTGGGQPHDTGTIMGQEIVDVEEIDGEIRHYLKSPLPEGTGAVTGSINWNRRFDHMQQHAGQHILSAAFEHLFDYKTVGFHLGVDNLTIDLETDNLTADEVLKVEKLANEIILENRPIEIKWVTEEELSQYALRKETKVKEDIRLVIIPEFDYNGCGGTHPKTTGEVRAIKILDWERQREKVRVQFACGDRIIKLLGEKQKVLLGLTKHLNAPEKGMETAVKRLLENDKRLEKELEQTRERLLQYEAKELLAKQNQLVAESFQNRTIQELQKLARLVVAEDDSSLVVFASVNDSRLQLVCARGASRTENMKKLISDVLPLINGKGGGNDSFAQGGGEALVSAEQILDKLITMIN